MRKPSPGSSGYICMKHTILPKLILDSADIIKPEELLFLARTERNTSVPV